MTQVQLAEATGSRQRSISYYENEDGIPPASMVISLAKALKISPDELLGIKPPRVEPDDAESKWLWKRFQMVAVLPAAPRKNGTQEERHVR